MSAWERRTALRCLVISCGLAAVGCPVDDRALYEVVINAGGNSGTAGKGGSSGKSSGSVAGVASDGGLGGQAGAEDTGGDSGLGGAASGGAASGGTTSGGTSSGGTSSGGTGGTSGGGGSGGKGGPCTEDVDQNGISDCSETLLSNGQFPTDAAAWVPQPSTTGAWNSMNALGSGSGSLDITNSYYADLNGNALFGSKQCIAVTGGSKYVAYAQVFLPGTADPKHTAGPVYYFYGGADCTETFLSAAPSPSTSGTNLWITLNAELNVPANAKSVLVILGASKPYKDPALMARFDNVLVRLK